MNKEGIMEKLYPAPWALSGKGYILIYKFNRNFVEEQGSLPYLTGHYAGGIGSVMLVDYTVSNAGPYRELLFIPGKFRHKGKKLNTISKIYVSTMASVVNGRRNWGIPKEQANFTFENLDNRHEHIRIYSGEDSIADFTIASGGISFPVSTKLMPFPLAQLYEGKYYYTTFYGHGKGKLARVKKITVNPRLLPDISLFKPIAVIKVEPFSIIFPMPRILNNN
jgi:hypothetical protein